MARLILSRKQKTLDINRESSLFPDETLILVDSEDNVIGYGSREECHHGDGLLHRAISIFIFSADKQLLIQKRSIEKHLWPLHWSNSVCSHPRKGENYEDAAIRRLKEELRIEAPLRSLFKFQYHARFSDIGSENEMCSVFIGKTNGPIRPNPYEIAEWKYVDFQTLDEDIRIYPSLFTPWFRAEWDRIQGHYLPEIRKL